MGTRERGYLLARFVRLRQGFGAISLCLGAVLLLPLVTFVFFPEELARGAGYGAPGLTLLCLGLVCTRLRRASEPLTLTLSEGALLLALGTPILVGVGALPLVLCESLPWSHAIFEATSGWTTTAASVVVPEESMRITLVWRSSLQWLGGVGFLVLTLGASHGRFQANFNAPVQALFGLAEARQGWHGPQCLRVLKRVLRLQIGAALLGCVALRGAGMDVFDALNHAMTAVSTGGFSTRSASAGAFEGIGIEIVLMALMLLGGLQVPYFLFKGLGGMRALKSGSSKAQSAFTWVLLCVGTACACVAALPGGRPWDAEVVRSALFHVVSAVTTTGYTLGSYAAWSPFGLLLLGGLMTIGGQTASSAGGIKQLRLLVLAHAFVRELRSPFQPQGALGAAQAGRVPSLGCTLVERAALFLFLYGIVWALGSLVLLWVRPELGAFAAMFEMASLQSNVGLPSGLARESAPAGLLWVQALVMILGRLETFLVVVGCLRILSDLRVLAAVRS